MAITAIEYVVIRTLREHRLLPLGGEILELGEANWYGDVPIGELRADIDRFAADEEREGLQGRLTEFVARTPPPLFALAKVFWGAFLHPQAMTAIDLHGGPQALKLDLNRPVDLGRQFGLVANLGTIEHVFNVAQAMETVHDHTRPGGVMLHGMPLTGWLEHGFYSFNSTFYFDVAAANDYEVLAAFYTELEPLKVVQLEDRDAIHRLSANGGLGGNSLIYVCLRKPATQAAFRYPMQGYYAGALSPDAQARWRSER